MVGLMPETLLHRLVQKYPLAKRQTLKRMVEAGRVTINGSRATRLSQPLVSGDRVEVLERVVSRKPPAAEAELPGIIFEDDDILVVNKPPGLLTSTVPREPRETLLARVRTYVSQRDPAARVGLIHRLDRDASGLLVFSKNEQAYQSLKSQFFHHTVRREYRALVHGVPDPAMGRIESRLVERADGTVHSTRQYGKGQIAVTDYEVIKTERKRTLVRVILQTGRKHQIRVHLAERGTPVVGDPVYGPGGKAARLMLAATKLTIDHPRTGTSTTFTVPLPVSFALTDE